MTSNTRGGLKGVRCTSLRRYILGDEFMGEVHADEDHDEPQAGKPWL
jgi:hypothetical protein